VIALTGDASARRFFRLELAEGGSLVAMAFDEPIDPETHPQLAVGRYLESLAVPVPHLEAAFPEAGLLLYEDLGDCLLQDLALTSLGQSPAVSGSLVSPPLGDPRVIGSIDGDAPAREVLRLYREAIELLSILQGPGTRGVPDGHPCSASALDRDRFLFELEFFREHYVERLRGLRLDSQELQCLRDFFDHTGREASAPPRVLCHRDFHSRNLMVKDARIRVVDFQDARMGPVAYDLASLVRDCYVVLPSRMREVLIEAFLERTEAATSVASFRESLDLVSLQRHLKAIGTFACQALAGKARYLASIAPAWDYVFDEIGRLPALSDAQPVLKRIAGR